jgi:hypothetical protein
MRRILYNIIKYPLIIIFLKSPIVFYLKRRFSKHRNLKHGGYFLNILDRLFEKEYLSKKKNKYSLRKILLSTVQNGEGERWAKYYFANSPNNFEDLKKRKVGSITDYENRPIYQKIVNHIKKNKLDQNNDTFIIQLGSSSGRDLIFFKKYFPKLNYISTDVSDEILNFQKKQYINDNLKYFNCFAEDIIKCINYFEINNKNIILFSIGSLQYVVPYFLKNFFLSILKIKNLNLFICEPVKLSFIDKNKEFSEYRGKASYSHLYEKYSLKFKTIEKKIIRPYEKSQRANKDVGTSFLHLKN